MTPVNVITVFLWSFETFPTGTAGIAHSSLHLELEYHRQENDNGPAYHDDGGSVRSLELESSESFHVLFRDLPIGSLSSAFSSFLFADEKSSRRESLASSASLRKLGSSQTGTSLQSQ